MGKGRIAIFAALAITVLALVAWTMFRTPTQPPEPFYHGQPLRCWLLLLNNGSPSDSEAATVLLEAGTNAIPALLRMLRVHEPPLKTKLVALMPLRVLKRMNYTDPNVINSEASQGFAALGPAGASAIPELSKILDEKLSWESENCAASVLARFGPEAKSAVPALLRASSDTSPIVRSTVFYALGKIHAEPATVVPVLIKGLRDTAGNPGRNALYALAEFKGEARAAVPAIVELLDKPNVYSNSTPSKFGSGLVASRYDIERALKQIDPETYARVATNAAPVTKQ